MERLCGRMAARGRPKGWSTGRNGWSDTIRSIAACATGRGRAMHMHSARGDWGRGRRRSIMAINSKVRRSSSSEVDCHRWHVGPGPPPLSPRSEASIAAGRRRARLRGRVFRPLLCRTMRCRGCGHRLVRTVRRRLHRLEATVGRTWLARTADRPLKHPDAPREGSVAAGRDHRLGLSAVRLVGHVRPT